MLATIYVAFVNDTKDKATLWIDDISAGVPACLEISSQIPRVIDYTGAITVSGTVSNTSTSDIDGFTVKYQFGDGEIFSETVNKKVKAGGSNSFRIKSPAEIAKNETLPYTIWVEAVGDESSATGKVSAYKRLIVAEEVTGTWCGYCVRGIVAMADMKSGYGDSFLGIAVHNGTESWEDPMSMPEYTDWLFSKFNMSGYPHCTVNRMVTYTGDPGNIFTYYSLLKYKENYTGLDLEADVDAEAKKVKARTTLYTSRDIEESNLRLAYVVIENDVHCGDTVDENGKPIRYNGYEQNNYYAGGGMGEMGGFEDMPEIIPGKDMWYQDVARYISDGFGGIEGSLPSEIKEGVGVSHEEEIILPDNIRQYENTELAVLLINGKTQEIVNAEVISLKDFFNPGSVDGIEGMETIFINRSGNTIKAECDATLTALNLYTSDGRLAASAKGTATSIEIETGTLDGLCIVEAVAADGRRVIKKIIL